MSNVDINTLYTQAQFELSRSIITKSKRMFHYTVTSDDLSIQIWIDSNGINSNEFISSISGYQGQYKDLDLGQLADMIYLDLSAKHPNTTIWIDIHKQNEPVGFYIEYNSIHK